MPVKRGKRWAAVVYDPATKAKRHVGTLDTRREAKDAEDQWRLARRRRTHDETCDGFAGRWTTDYPRPRDRTNEHNAQQVKRFGRDFKGVRLSAIDRPTARRWALEHRSMVGAVRAMFGDALRDGLCDINPFAGLRLEGSEGRRHIVALTEAELTRLDELAQKKFGEYGQEYGAMILFAGYVGLRPGELFALEPGDIDGQFVEISKSQDPKRRITPPKNGRARTAIIPPPAQDALERVPRDRERLFLTRTGLPFTQANHHYHWDPVRCLFGKPGLDFYELRHAAATILLERGVTPWDVAIQLGHTDGGQLVQQRYGHPSHANARARLLAAWGGPWGDGASVAPLREAREISEAKREQA